MAGIAVFVDLRGDAPTRPTLWAIKQARRVANTMGATVHAIVGTAGDLQETDERLAAALGAAGADRVVLCHDPVFAGAASPSTHGRLAELFVNRLHPRLLLFPAGSIGAELATWVAARTGAQLALRAAIVRDDEDAARFDLVQRDPDAEPRPAWRRLRLDVDGSRTIVATLAAGELDSNPVGAHAAELDELSYPTTVGTASRDRVPASSADGRADVELASLLVLLVGPSRAEDERRIAATLPAGGAVVSRGDRWLPELAFAAPMRVLIVARDDLSGEPPPLALPPTAVVAYAASSKPPAGWPAAEVHWKSVGDAAVAAIVDALAAETEGVRA